MADKTFIHDQSPKTREGAMLRSMLASSKPGKSYPFPGLIPALEGSAELTCIDVATEPNAAKYRVSYYGIEFGTIEITDEEQNIRTVMEVA